MAHSKWCDSILELSSSTHRCREGKAHTLLCTSKLVCTKIYTCAYSHMCKEYHHAHTPTLFSPALCSLLLIHPTFNRSLLWIQKCSQVPPTQREEDLKWISNETKKRAAAECFIKHLWRTLRIWVLVADAGPPQCPSSFINHQPSEEELLHQRALWDAEYLMLHLVKTQLHFCSDLPWQWLQ